MDWIVLGWIGNLFLAFCGAPQAYKCWKDGNSDGISWGFLFLWGMGEILSLIYTIGIINLSFSKILVYIGNYAMNIFLISVILKYKIKPVTRNIIVEVKESKSDVSDT